MARSRRPAVHGIVEPRLRLSTLAVSGLSAVLGAMILYNIFLGQETIHPALSQVAGEGSTRMTVAAPGKQSSVVTLKYDELVEDIQRELLATGHFQDMVDGVNGPKTRVAIELYQREHNLDIDGRPTAALLDHIRYTRKLAQAAEFTGSIEPLAEAGSRSLTVANGAHSLVQVPDLDSGQTDAVVWRVQERLARLGYGPDTRSGRLDPETVAAILKFELDHGLDMDGKLSKALLEAIDAAERQLAAQ